MDDDYDSRDESSICDSEAGDLYEELIVVGKGGGYHDGACYSQ